MKFTGVMPALISPLRADETIDTAALPKLIDYLLQKGADGFYVGGATGEGIALSEEQRMVLAQEAVNATNGAKPCIIHVASANFNEAVRLAKHAESVGAAAISAIPPLFYKYDEDDVFQYYKRLAESVHIPLMIYFNPAAGFNINAPFAAKMFEVDNITAIKWTSPNYYEMLRLKDLTHGEMNIINGPDETLLMGLSAGADGGIGTTYNFMMPLFRNIYDSFTKGDLQTAQARQMDVARIISALRLCPSIPAVKILLKEMGINIGNAVFPMKQLDEKKKAEFISAMKAAGWTY